MFSVFTKLAVSGEGAQAALSAAELSLILCPAGTLLPFVQYVVSLAIVQAVQQLTHQQLQGQLATATGHGSCS